jgi:hypothetical protein
MCNPVALTRLFFEKLQWGRAKGIRRRQGWSGHGSGKFEQVIDPTLHLYSRVTEVHCANLRQLARKNNFRRLRNFIDDNRCNAH